MDLNTHIDECVFTVVDLETTGLDVVTGDAICEIGAVKLKEKQVVDTFQTLVNPERPIPQEASRIHKIYDHDVADAPVFGDVAQKLLAFLEGTVICAYNAPFDMGFLDNQLQKNNYAALQMPTIDILAMARMNVQSSRYTLATLVAFFQIVVPGQMHRALADAQAASEVFVRLSDIIKGKGVNRLGDFISLYGFNNDVCQERQGQKLTALREGIVNRKPLRMRYFSHQNRMETMDIVPISLTRERQHFYLWCQRPEGSSFRLGLKRVFDIEIV